METRVFLGKKPDTIRRRADGSLDTTLPPQLELSVPILFSAMSYGSISYNAHAALARAAEELGIYYNTGEGGLHRGFLQVRRKHDRAGSLRPLRHRGALSERRCRHRDQNGSGRKARHRRTSARREDRRGRVQDPHDPRGLRRHLPRAASRHLFHRGPAPARILAQRSNAV